MQPEYTTDDGAALEHVRSRYRVMHDYKARYTDRNLTHYELYRGHTKPKYYFKTQIPRPNIHVPYSFASIEQLVPRLVQGVLLDGYNFFDAYPREKSDRSSAEKNKKLLQWQIRQCNFYLEMSMFLKTSTIFGYCAGMVFWEYLVGKTIKQVPKDEYAKALANDVMREVIMSQYGKGIYDEIEEEIVTYSGNSFASIDWNDFYPDPAARYTLHNGRDFIHRTKKTIRELKEAKKPDGTPMYKNLSQITPRASGMDEEDSEADARLAATTGATRHTWVQNETMIHDKDAHEVTLWNYWTTDRIITVANEKVVIRNDKNPYGHGRIPAVDFNFTYVPNELFGIGAIESFRDLQIALNALVNLDFENWNLIVNQMFLVDRAADVAKEQLVSRPGGVIYTSIPPAQAVQPLPRNSIAMETNAKKQELAAYIQIASGLSDIHYLGSSGGGPVTRTATGAATASQEANLRVRAITVLAEKMVLEPMLKMWTANNNQFLSDPQWIRITGEAEPTKINPWEVWGEYDYEFRGSSRLANEEIGQHNFTNFLRVAGSNPAFLTKMNITGILRKAMDLYSQDESDELILKDPWEKVTPWQEHHLMMYGQPVEPSIDEDFMMHYQEHLQFISNPVFMNIPPENQALFLEHLQKTQAIVELAMGAQMGREAATQTGPVSETASNAAVQRDAAGVGYNAQNAGGGGEYVE